MLFDYMRVYIYSYCLTDQNNLDLSATMDAVGEFLKLAAADFKDVAPRRRRAKHLFCMPLVGTGHGVSRRA